jgi:hypothetical protein
MTAAFRLQQILLHAQGLANAGSRVYSAWYAQAPNPMAQLRYVWLMRALSGAIFAKVYLTSIVLRNVANASENMESPGCHHHSFSGFDDLGTKL